MHTVTVDDESLAVSAMQRILKKADPEGIHAGFYRVSDFFSYVEQHDDIDIAFVDVEMSTDGITVTRKLKKMCPGMNIVIYSGYTEYKADAMDEHVSSYIVKPVTDEKLRTALENLRYPIRENHIPARLRVITFGNFVVYRSDGKLLTFSNSRSLDVFAYLVDRCGFPVTAKDIARDVFEKPDFDKQTSKDISKYVIAMIKDLENAGCGDAVIKQGKNIKINRSCISCDLYDALDGNTEAMAAYKGEYMIEYNFANSSDTADDLNKKIRS